MVEPHHLHYPRLLSQPLYLRLPSLHLSTIVSTLISYGLLYFNLDRCPHPYIYRGLPFLHLHLQLPPHHPSTTVSTPISTDSSALLCHVPSTSASTSLSSASSTDLYSSRHDKSHPNSFICRRLHNFHANVGYAASILLTCPPSSSAQST
ncbi:hypothetical protein Fot_37718 [Forsythia ovata]|uniref:Cytochrome c biogenesis B n=1 Tax=Forsythia ovata TaxID=205694 RepID=A0ABD1RZS4_9LAMI